MLRVLELQSIDTLFRVDLAQAEAAVGRAFCFLPLPVLTGLPVHINGYFELSSNRRDIWFVFLCLPQRPQDPAFSF